jgi:hypothetical protein
MTVALARTLPVIVVNALILKTTVLFPGKNFTSKYEAVNWESGIQVKREVVLMNLSASTDPSSMWSCSSKERILMVAVDGRRREL